MQPFVAVSARAPGLIYLNGRLAGESGADAPLIAPVAPTGVCYLEHRPFGAEHLPCAHRIVFSNGKPARTDGLYIVYWSWGVCEVELPARPVKQRENDYFSIFGKPCAILRGAETLVRFAGETLRAPEGAEIPAPVEDNTAYLLVGRAGNGMYACCFSRDGGRPLGACEGDTVEAEGGGRVRCITRLNDVTGHVRVETWLAGDSGFSMEMSEIMWLSGAPRLPATPAETARAAVEASLLGIGGEADSFLAPNLRGQGYTRAATGNADACVEMRFAPPSGGNAVGLLYSESENFARVEPLAFRVSPAGGDMGTWLVEKFGA